MIENLLKESIVQSLGVEPLTAQCLLDIGLNSVEECSDFLHPENTQLTDVSLYNGYAEVKERILQAIENKEKVVIYGDYDCDGVCSCAMLYTFLKERDVEVYYYIPSRHANGYGINIESLEEICEEYLPDLLISVDCGITSVEEVEYIQEALGFDVVITDHHKPQEILPNCPIFNPHLTGGVFNDLCGAGVVLRLIEGMSSYKESLKYYDLATLATIADLVPLVKDNRKIASIGLDKINSRQRVGLNMLIQSANLDVVTSQDVAFKLAPRINAVGRLDDASKVVSLFYEKERFVLTTLIEEINELNKKRQDLTAKTVAKVEEKLARFDFEKNPIICLYDKSWDEGVIGIVAAKIVTDYNRPTILFTMSNGLLKGSGRSTKTIDLFKCVSKAKDLLAKFGGHKQACGLSVTQDNFEEFRLKINEYLLNSNDCVIEEDEEKSYDFHQIKNLAKQTREIQMLEPFGEKNPPPLFYSEVDAINFKRMKSGSDHLIFKTSAFQMLAFFMGSKLDILNSSVRKKMYFNLGLNLYNNKLTVAANLKEFECINESDEMPLDFLESALYDDKSIFKPKCITFDDALVFAQNSAYYTAYVCYCKETFEKAKELLKDVNINIYYTKYKTPKNSLYFSPNVDENLDKYKNLVYLDRPISLGVIDELKLDKDCNVYYVESTDALKVLAKDMLDYEMLGQLYVALKGILLKNNKIDLQQIFIDIEKKLNVNYNNFVVALYVFIDLGLIEKQDGYLKLNLSVKNKITNSKLYNKILGAK